MSGRNQEKDSPRKILPLFFVSRYGNGSNESLRLFAGVIKARLPSRATSPRWRSIRVRVAPHTCWGPTWGARVVSLTKSRRIPINHPKNVAFLFRDQADRGWSRAAGVPAGLRTSGPRGGEKGAAKGGPSMLYCFSPHPGIPPASTFHWNNPYHPPWSSPCAKKPKSQKAKKPKCALRDFAACSPAHRPLCWARARGKREALRCCVPCGLYVCPCHTLFFDRCGFDRVLAVCLQAIAAEVFEQEGVVSRSC